MLSEGFRFETSWDDWCEENWRIAELLKKYNLPGVFYLPLNFTPWREAKKLEKMGFRIECHSASHPPDLKKLTPGEKWMEIVNAKKTLEKLLNHSVISYCYPRGRYDDDCVELVKEAGYMEARTTQVLQTSYKDPFRKPTTIHWYQRVEYKDVPILETAKRWFDLAIEQDGYFHLWAHGWELTKMGEWNNIELFLDYVSQKINQMRILRETQEGLSLQNKKE